MGGGLASPALKYQVFGALLENGKDPSCVTLPGGSVSGRKRQKLLCRKRQRKTQEVVSNECG